MIKTTINNIREKYKVDCGYSLTLEDIGITDNVNNRYVKRESNHIKFDNVTSLYNNDLCIANYNLVQIYIAQPTGVCGNMAATPKSVLTLRENMGATVITIRDNRNIST